mmetsp:Transcript_39501/g.111996  ORF Transcript_39501/g.111996 Transcript_39501/m.111996 type:complete len:202 (-) Transcript_39501:18-623(-)
MQKGTQEGGILCMRPAGRAGGPGRAGVQGAVFRSCRAGYAPPICRFESCQWSQPVGCWTNSSCGRRADVQTLCCVHKRLPLTQIVRMMPKIWIARRSGIQRAAAFPWPHRPYTGMLFHHISGYGTRADPVSMRPVAHRLAASPISGEPPGSHCLRQCWTQRGQRYLEQQGCTRFGAPLDHKEGGRRKSTPRWGQQPRQVVW